MLFSMKSSGAALLGLISLASLANAAYSTT
jgi:hypothetical protein